MISLPKLAAALTFTFAGWLDHVWQATHTGIIGAAAFVGAVATVWMWVLRPFFKHTNRLVRQIGAVHTVILGDKEEGVPSLTTRLDRQDARLVAGEERFAAVEDKVDGLRHEISGPGGVKERVRKVEGIFDVIGSSERLEIRSAISAASEDRRGRRHAQHPHSAVHLVQEVVELDEDDDEPPPNGANGGV